MTEKPSGPGEESRKMDMQVWCGPAIAMYSSSS